MTDSILLNQYKVYQSMLTAAGYPVGPIDGRIGNVTVKALRKFQSIRKLPITGEFDKQTLAALNKPKAVSSEVAAIVAPHDAPVIAVPVAVKNNWPMQANVSKFYGAVGTDQGTLHLPFDMKLSWDLRKIIHSMTLHKKVIDSAQRCFNAIAEKYDAEARTALGLDVFGGSLNVRKMRGGNNYSMHSWGIAIDFDPAKNQLKWGRDKARLASAEAVPFWEIWEAEGWTSLGRKKNFDWQHVQAASL